MKNFTNENNTVNTNSTAFNPIHGVEELNMQEVIEMRNTMSRKTQTYCFAKNGNNFTAPQQALGEIVWNGIGAGHARNIWVWYDPETQLLHILNDGSLCDINALFQFGISTSDSPLSQHGTGTTNATAYFNPSNNRFYVIVRLEDGSYQCICAPFAETMQVGEPSQEDIEEMQFRGPGAVTEYCVYDENKVLADMDFFHVLGSMCAIAIMNGLNVYFNGKRVEPVIDDCGALNGPDGAVWQHEELVETPEGNFVLQWTHIDNVCNPSLDTQALHMSFNGVRMEYKGVRLFKHATRANQSLKPHPCHNGMRTFVNIVTDGIADALVVPFNNTKTGIRWNAKPAKALRDAIDARCGDAYRFAYALNTEAGKRKAIDYIAKELFWTVDDIVEYKTEVKLAPYGLTCDALIYSGAPFSLDNVRNGKTTIHGIVEFKKANLNCSHVVQTVGYALSAIPADSGVRMPRLVFVGGNVAKYADHLMENINGHLKTPLLYKKMDYSKMNKLWEDNV